MVHTNTKTTAKGPAAAIFCKHRHPSAATRTMGLHLALAGLTVLIALPISASAESVPAVPQLAQSGDARSFSIPSQPLSSALATFADQAGISFIYKTGDLSGRNSPGIAGTLTTTEALRRLLAGSGISYQFTDPQTITLQAASDGGAFRMDPIVIEGEKTQRSYLETYTSVGIATGEDIETYNVDDLPDSFNNMANVRLFSNSRGNNGFQIRGVNADGVTQPSNSAPLISVIIDGATQSAEGLKRGSRGVWDIKQIEVLRGPQSTLQGRNALAGAVVIETNDPTYEPEMTMKALAGSLDRKDAAFAVSAPIIDDQLAFRLSSEYRDQAKDVEFSDDGNKPFTNDEFFNVRGKLLMEPRAVEALSALVTVSHTFDNPTAAAVTGPDFYARKFAPASTSTEFREMVVDNYVADVAYAFDNNWILRSVSSVNETDLAIFSSPQSASYTRDDHRRDSDFSEDLRFEVGNGISGLSGLFGLFYGDFSQKVQSYIASGATVYQDGIFINETETLAAYTDLRYRIFDRWSLIGGLRYQHDTVHNFIDTASAFGDSYADREAEYDVLLPKLGLAYDLGETQTVAATASRGYRQGLTEALSGTSTIHAVDPEFVWTYEVAYRQTSSDGRLNFGANVFYNSYKDQQIAITNASTAQSNTFNAGDSISYGTEIDGRYEFGNGFHMFGSLGLLKTELGDFRDNACSPSGGNCKGNEFPEAPRFTAALGGAYTHHSGLFASASANYTGEYFTQGEINNREHYKIHERYLVNIKVGYATDNAAISLYADNLFDEQYLTGLSNSSSSSNEASIGDGRTIGAEVRFKF